MTIDKYLTLDLNRIQPEKVVTMHEGDTNSVSIVLTITENGSEVDLTGLTIKYDATIANFLAEQDADGLISNNKIVIPVTSNMTAMGGVLKVDVKMISGTEVLYTQTVSGIVEKSVINNSTIIDISGTSIGARLTQLETAINKLESESSNYVPKTRKITDNINLQNDISTSSLRAALNILDVITVDAETSETWDDEIPTTYDGGGRRCVFWNGYLWVCYSIAEHQGETVYHWARLLDEEDINDLLGGKMTLAPFVYDESDIQSLPAGQAFVLNQSQNNPALIGFKDGSGVARTYTKGYIDENFLKTTAIQKNTIRPMAYSTVNKAFEIGTIWLVTGYPTRSYQLASISKDTSSGRTEYRYYWVPLGPRITTSSEVPPSSEEEIWASYGSGLSGAPVTTYQSGDYYHQKNDEMGIDILYLCVGVSPRKNIGGSLGYEYEWKALS